MCLRASGPGCQSCGAWEPQLLKSMSPNSHAPRPKGPHNGRPVQLNAERPLLDATREKPVQQQ